MTDQRISQGTHPTRFSEIREVFGVGEKRQLVLDTADVVIRRLREVAGMPTVLLGGPVTDLVYPGVMPFARIGAYVDSPLDLERSVIDNDLWSLLTIGGVSFRMPFERSDLRELHVVGGLVQAFLVHRRSVSHLTWWVGKLIDSRGLERPDGASAGVSEVIE